MSQNDSLLERFFLRSSVSKSLFISTCNVFTPGQFNSSISLTASGSNCIAAKIIIFGFGTKDCASSIASATCRRSNGAYSGPKEIITLLGSDSFVIASACIHLVAGCDSTPVNSIF